MANRIMKPQRIIQKKASIQIARIIELTSDIKMIEIQLFIVFIVNDCKYPFDA